MRVQDSTRQDKTKTFRKPIAKICGKLPIVQCRQYVSVWKTLWNGDSAEKALP